MRISDWSSDVCSSDLLHLSYAWRPTGFVLLGCTMLHPLLPVSSAVHALGAGAMGAMTLAVMTRATRGHTGRPLEADRATVLIYIFVHSGALLRVIAPLLPFAYMAVLAVAGGLWESGRAACRERVCQYVESSGVAVS